MSSGVFRKLARARKVAHAAGFLLQKLEAQFGHEFGEGMRIQVRQATADAPYRPWLAQSDLLSTLEENNGPRSK